MFEWWDKQVEPDLECTANAAGALPVTRSSIEKTFSGLRYIPNELRLGLKEDII